MEQTKQWVVVMTGYKYDIGLCGFDTEEKAHRKMESIIKIEKSVGNYNHSFYVKDMNREESSVDAPFKLSLDYYEEDLSEYDRLMEAFEVMNTQLNTLEFEVQRLYKYHNELVDDFHNEVHHTKHMIEELKTDINYCRNRMVRKY